MKTSKLLLVGAVALFAFASCESSDELGDGSQVYDDAYYAARASISSSDTHFTSTSEGGTVSFKAAGGEIVISVSCGTEWTAQNGSGDTFGYSMQPTSLTITAEQNLVEEELSGTITLMTAENHIKFSTITVTQNAYGAPEITVDTNEWHVPAVGENMTATIGVEATDEWTVECGAEWLKIEKSGASLNLTAADNEDTEERTTEIVLNCTDGYNSDSETIRVTQEGLAYITLSEVSLEFDANGGEAVVTVESNYEWEYAYSCDWFSIKENEEDGSLTITCDTSDIEEDREETVTFTAGDGAANIIEVELAIVQTAYLMPEITVETKEWHAPAVGELTTEIGVEANYEWTFEVDADWLTAGKTETGITLSAKENQETTERTGEIVLTCTDGVKAVADTIAVTQDGRAYIKLSNDELTLSNSEGSIRVTIESNFEWEYNYDADWLTITKLIQGGTMQIAYTANNTGSDREETVIITSGDCVENVVEVELKITQSCNNLDVLILEYTITSNNVTIGLPMWCANYGDSDTVTIDWDDGSTETVQIWYGSPNSRANHKYTTPGIYAVSVKGDFSGFSYSGREGKEYLTSVRQWGKANPTTMQSAFYECSNLATLPEGVCPYSNVTSFEYAFYNCKSLTNAPSFSGCTTATNFNNCFYGCSSLTSVPENMFSGCTHVTGFSHCFYGCSSLTSIPENMFSGCTRAAGFSSCFYGCSSLTNVPENIFSDCSAVTSGFSDCFRQCPLTNAPSFSGCTAATNFSNCFYGCSSLTSIPENIFSDCSAVTTFSNCFYGCSSLTSIPENIFSNCLAATTFSNCFSSCSSLKDVPANMFDGILNIANFSKTFYGCSSVVGESPYTVIELDGEKVKIHIYERSDYALNMRYYIPTSYEDCFTNSTFSDIDSIPSSWGGNGD